MKNKKLMGQVLIAIFAAWAFVLRLLEFPILPFAPFLKLDFSDIAVMMGMLVKGPVGAVGVAAVRDILNYLRTGGDAGLPIGAVMSFIASMAVTLPLHYLLTQWRVKWQWKQAALSVGAATLSLTIVLSLLNYFVALPIYVEVLNFHVPSFNEFVLGLVVPFNLIKGLVIGVAQVMIVNSCRRLLAKRQWLLPRYADTDSASNE